MAIPLLDDNQIIKTVNDQKNPFFKEYYAFYSSWYGGITKNPHLMLLPSDDHMVHRGDGVFEGIKSVGRAVYLFDEHLKRLHESAKKIALKPSVSYEEMKKIIVETLRAADQSDVMIRVFLSRGPGSFSVNPYDSIGSQLYVMVHQLHHPAPSKYTEGVRIGPSTIPVKSPLLAQTKSCNYLPNVLMKKEAVDRKLDFVIGVDPQNNVTESATENIMIVDQSGVIIHPLPDYILNGITMVRACELARANGLTTIAKSISLADLQSAREVMLTGTTLNVLPVVEFEGQKIGTGKPGYISAKLQELVIEDIQRGYHSFPL